MGILQVSGATHALARDFLSGLHAQISDDNFTRNFVRILMAVFLWSELFDHAPAYHAGSTLQGMPAMDRKRKAVKKGTGRDNAAAQEDCARVDDDFPENIPISTAELDAIESFLGRLLDELL